MRRVPKRPGKLNGICCTRRFAGIDDAIITTDARDHITFLNPAAAALTGWTPEEAADLPLDAVFRTVREGDVVASENLGASASRVAGDGRV
jgi:PAS domain-containing protein